MKDDAHPTKRHGNQGNVQKLLTPKMREDFVRLKEQMEEFAGRLVGLCDSLEEINSAIFDAQEIAECLIDDDLFGACDVIKRRQARDGTNPEADWE